jgi:hypothetical protein
MAKVMPFTDPYGNALATSYWYVVQVNLGIADRTANIVLYGYKDRQARKQGKASVGSKSYAVSGEKFDQMMKAHLSPGGPNLMRLIYEQVVNGIKDVPAPTPEDPDAKKSFFEGATDEVD